MVFGPRSSLKECGLLDKVSLRCNISPNTLEQYFKRALIFDYVKETITFSECQ